MTSEAFALTRHCDYGSVDFWNSRYAEFPLSFEWYIDYDHSSLKDIIRTYCRKDGKILVVGCGNSSLSEKMCDDGFKIIYNVDFSNVVIDQMKSKHVDNKSLKWQQMDCTKMTFQDEEFDYVIDKGTLDCVFCTYDADIHINSYRDEIERILKVGGKYIVISPGDVESRLELLENSDNQSVMFTSFDCKVCAIEKPRIKEDPTIEEFLGAVDIERQNYFVYICRKEDAKAELKMKMKNT